MDCICTQRCLVPCLRSTDSTGIRSVHGHCLWTAAERWAARSASEAECTLLKSLHPHVRDRRITFVADTHTYYVDGRPTMGANIFRAAANASLINVGPCWHAMEPALRVDIPCPSALRGLSVIDLCRSSCLVHTPISSAWCPRDVCARAGSVTGLIHRFSAPFEPDVAIRAMMSSARWPRPSWSGPPP